jgi:hypothetical protein
VNRCCALYRSWQSLVSEPSRTVVIIVPSFCQGIINNYNLFVAYLFDSIILCFGIYYLLFHVSLGLLYYAKHRYIARWTHQGWQDSHHAHLTGLSTLIVILFTTMYIRGLG